MRTDKEQDSLLCRHIGPSVAIGGDVSPEHLAALLHS